MQQYLPKYIGIWIFLIIALFSSCRSNSYKNTSQSFPEVPQGIVEGIVLEAKMGHSVRDHETMQIIANKGTKEGIRTGTRGCIRFHKAGFNEFQVLNVWRDSSQLMGWYIPSIGIGDTIVFNVGNLSDEEFLNYFK